MTAGPNIVFIFTDDQDYHHGSLDTMKAVQDELVAKGTLFTNHYATISTKLQQLDPYINRHDAVVMSEDGQRPKLYQGFQQTDVVRIKALSRLDALLQQEDPFFLMIAPTAPHVHNITDPPIPPARYLDRFTNKTVPRTPNFNPPDRFQQGKPAWVGKLPLLSQSQIDETEQLYRRRLQSLQGVDDIVRDVVAKLEEEGALENTYIIYSTDQGYHLGTHRHAAGKSTPYLEDTNIPLVVRGPGVQSGAISTTPSTVTDFAPTFLEIAGLAEGTQPQFLDGASLLEAWKTPNSSAIALKKEAINVEFWGYGFTEIPLASGGVPGYLPGYFLDNDYKTMRIVGEKSAWLYSRWCTNDTELYNTLDDPYELNNLANSTKPEVSRVHARLNALLLVTKSCAEDTCREPWTVLQPPASLTNGKVVTTLEEALDPAYDDFYAAFPTVTIDECLNLQIPSNEAPFYPPGAEAGLGMAYRENTDGFNVPDPVPVKPIPGQEVTPGGWEHRHASFETLMASARELEDDEIETTS
ncbi:hypothetical protein SLS56_008078 [Neofusicoccum ribis]|uniref:Sulfatase N-terminal domain-containing protein n=1 Tax=Neofusicoccum ribis TaxID=45134 RepID=A0ABR3SL67_9PEZI